MSLYIQIDKQRDQVVQLTEQQLPEDFIVLVEVLQAECVSAFSAAVDMSIAAWSCSARTSSPHRCLG